MPVTLGNIAFQALSLAVTGAFCVMIYLFRSQAAMCLESAVQFSKKENNAQAENKAVYDRFLRVATTLGAISAGLAAVKALAAVLEAGEAARMAAQGAATAMGAHGGTGGFGGLGGFGGFGGLGGLGETLARIAADPPTWLPAVGAAAVAIAVMCVAAAQAGVLKAAGKLTLSQSFTDAVAKGKKNMLAALSLVAVPGVAIWTGVNPERDAIVAYVIAGAAVAAAALFVVHSLAGFVKQKVSLLVWFLYLCTVEIFPVWAIAVALTGSV